MGKTIKEINNKIKQGDALVVTADEMVDIVEDEGVSKASRKVDVVTTGTFGPMCSSGVFLNFGHPRPKMKMQEVYLNDVRAHAGLAAVDVYLGATQMSEKDSLNRVHPGNFLYGGGHVIQDLIEGKEITLKSSAYGTDCYPRTEVEAQITLNDLNEAIMHNPRNAYQNYNCAVNVSDETIYTYMGKLKPGLGNANYCSAGQLSPLLNDPEFKTMGIGTKIFLGGATGYITWNGTQHVTDVPRNKVGIPKAPAGTLTVTGDLKQMSSKWIKGVSMMGYGVSLMVGIGIPIPVINEEVAASCGASDKDIECPIVDYSSDYPAANGKTLGSVNYEELKSGEIEIEGQKVPTASLSSYYRATQIAKILKDNITAGDFLLGEPQKMIPGPGQTESFKSLKISNNE
ncbi:MAG: homocysteine biosynthesis protein [Elusimicrobiota bacterium]